MKNDFLDDSALKGRLKEFAIVERIYYYKEIDSTNTRAVRLAQYGLQHSSLFLAEFQTKGRGRFKRNWLAKAGESLLFSLALFPSFPKEKWSGITLLASVAVVEALGKFGIKGAVKWPNDVLVGGKKISGILIETAQPGDKNKKGSAIVGVGINVNQESFETDAAFATPPTSMRIETGKEIERIKVLCEFLTSFSRLYYSLEAGDYRDILKRYKGFSSTIGKSVALNSSHELIHGTASDIDEDGSLIIRLDSGAMRRITAGDVAEIEWK